MDWTLVALSQMLLMTIGVSVALGLRIRGVNRTNAELREHAELANAALAENESGKAGTSTDWLAEKLAALDPEDPYTPLISLVLNHAAEANDEFAGQLTETLAAAGLGGHNPESGDGVVQDQSEDLKNLLQQFTKDSREMMACIQTLEQENASLREQLGLEPTVPLDNNDTADEPEATAAQDNIEADVAADDPLQDVINSLEDSAEGGAEERAEESAEDTPAEGTAAAADNQIPVQEENDQAEQSEEAEDKPEAAPA